ncbi:hypothetical protein HF521_019642 [Silurus meridionalis]|uniref:Uncharacterized protein n=1 Tax=Silurus meridionalis TaxID=175797 RepID=A0A8T0BH20_SILME|nr:hypothetical protein HF521_019642 [Silurus meridionalis]
MALIDSNAATPLGIHTRGTVGLVCFYLSLYFESLTACVCQHIWPINLILILMGGYDLKERNVEGQMVVDLAKRIEMAVVNTYFKKKEDHRVTYTSGGRCTQVDYVLCRRCNLKEIGDCKVLAGDSVARQHRMVVCRIIWEVTNKRRSVRTERRIRWWKLKEEDCRVRFREEVRQGLGGGEEVLDDWATTAEVKGRQLER